MGLDIHNIAPDMRQHTPEDAGKYISKQEHDRRIAWAKDRFNGLIGSPEWQAAVAPEDPSTLMSVHVITPEHEGPQAHFIRAGADARNDLEFAKKDGDDPDETAAKYSRYAENDIRVAVIHHGENGVSNVVCALRAVKYTPETSSPGVDAIASEWGQNPHDALQHITLPDGTSAAGLLQHDGVYDLTLTSTDSEWVGGSNALRSNALMALYKATLAIISSRGGQYIIGGMDVKGIFGQLNGRGSDAWIDAFPDDHRAILTSVKDSNISTFAICDTFQWQHDTQHGRPRRHDMLWGETLVERGVVFHGLDNRHGGTVPGSELIPLSAIELPPLDPANANRLIEALRRVTRNSGGNAAA